jgi:membrane-associated phospholipid phosphatase
LFLRAGYVRALAVGPPLGGHHLRHRQAARGPCPPPVEHLQAVTGASFSSGHATEASAFWISLLLALHSLQLGRNAFAAILALVVLLVLVVCLTRLYLGVHYPADVSAGVLLGSTWAVYVSSCVRREIA